MISRKRFSAIGILVLIGLMISPVSVFAAKLLGSQFPIANDTLREVTPSIAYNSQRNHYLVVWSNDRPSNDDIRAQKVAADGSLIGGPFYISGGPGHDRWKPDVTYDSVQDQYLVVWEDYENVGTFKGNSIRARRVSGTGMVLDANDLTIRAKSTTFYTPSDPAVAFSAAFNRYLVVWHEVTHVGTPTHYITSQVVKPDGTLEGTPKQISSSTKIHSAPDVAYNPRENRYMVTWQEYNSGTNVYDVKGHQVVGNGNLYGSTITYGDSGKAHEGPVVAALPNNSNNNTYMIEWIQSNPPWNGYGFAYTDRFGTKLGGGSASSTSDSHHHIALAANPNSETYLIGIQFERGIMDKSIYLFQRDRDIFWLDYFDVPGPANDFPAIAAGPTGDYLVVWQGQPLSITHTNIYGQIIGNRSYLPLMKK